MAKNNTDFFLEILDDRLKTVNGALTSIKTNTDTIPEIHERLVTLEEKVTTIEKAVTETNQDLNQLENRVTVLEEAA